MPPTSPAADAVAGVGGATLDTDPSMQAIMVSIRRMLDEDRPAPGGPGGEIGATPAALGDGIEDDGLVLADAAGEAVGLVHPGPSLEDVVRAELRPMLKQWLDTQLPGLIERLVRAEIVRVVRRAAG
jgi:hypothetical protein